MAKLNPLRVPPRLSAVKMDGQNNNHAMAIENQPQHNTKPSHAPVSSRLLSRDSEVFFCMGPTVLHKRRWRAGLGDDFHE